MTHWSRPLPRPKSYNPHYGREEASMANLEKRSKRLARDICKILGASPTHKQDIEVVDAIRAELAPDPQPAMRIIKALPELLADYEHCALDADRKRDSSRARSICKIRRQVEGLLHNRQ